MRLQGIGASKKGRSWEKKKNPRYSCAQGKRKNEKGRIGARQGKKKDLEKKKKTIGGALEPMSESRKGGGYASCFPHAWRRGGARPRGARSCLTREEGGEKKPGIRFLGVGGKGGKGKGRIRSEDPPKHSGEKHFGNRPGRKEKRGGAQ